MAGESAVQLAAEYGMSRGAIARHRTAHLSLTAAQIGGEKNALAIISYAHDLYQRAGKVLDRAEEMLRDSDAGPRAVMAAAGSLREVRQSIELLARLVTSEPEAEDLSRNADLDALITQALSSVTLPALGPGPQVEDAVVLS